MTFRINSPIDSNQHKGLLGVNSINGSPLAITGLSLTNAQPLHTALVDATGSQITSFNSTATPSNIFRDNFTTQDTTNWTFTTDANDLLYNGGNVASSSYLSVCKSALVADTYTEIITNNTWPISVLTAAGLTLSQRIAGQHFAYDLVAVDANGNPINNTTVADIALNNAAGAVVSANVVTFTTNTAHGLLPGDLVIIYGCTDPRMNVGETIVTSVPTSTTFTVANTIANATYTVGTSAFVRFSSISKYAQYIMGYMFTGVSATNDSTFSNNGARQPEIPASNQVSNATNATIANENGLNYSGLAYTDAFRAFQEFILKLNQKHAQYTIRAVDSNAIPGSTVHRSHNIPVQISNNFKIRLRARNFPNLSVPIAPITAASKSGSAVATLTVPNHGLTTSDFIAIVGIRDQVNFVDTTAATAVASVVDANTITVSFGAIATTTSYGGWVMRIHGQATIPSTTSSAIQTYALTADNARLSLVFAASQSTPTVGEVWTLYGLVDSTNTNHPELNGRYKVALSNTTTFTMELIPLDNQVISGVPSSPTNCGGGLVKNTEYRIHFLRAESTTPTDIEIVGGDGNGDFAQAIPVQPTNTPNISTVTTVSTVTSMTQMGGFILKDTLLNFMQEDSWANAVRARIT